MALFRQPEILMQAQPASKPPDHLTDAELVAAVRAGDRRAMETLMRSYNRVMYRTARAILHDDAEAEDAVQEAYLHAYGALGTFRGESKLSTWLVRIAANEALMRRRRSKRSAAILPIDPASTSMDEMDSQPSQDDGPETQTLRAEMRRLLEQRIDALPDAYRTVFVLRAVEELSVEETAAVLGIPQATVRTQFFRARALLRTSLDRDIDRGLEDAFAFAGERCDRIVAAVLAKI
jgi:RNA polymerase sigma-70 factor, ECF subfamily